jgi:hypothetical protein
MLRLTLLLVLFSETYTTWKGQRKDDARAQISRTAFPSFRQGIDHGEPHISNKWAICYARSVPSLFNDQSDLDKGIKRVIIARAALRVSKPRSSPTDPGSE